jgi:hypothetical protein
MEDLAFRRGCNVQAIDDGAGPSDDWIWTRERRMKSEALELCLDGVGASHEWKLDDEARDQNCDDTGMADALRIANNRLMTIRI